MGKRDYFKLGTSNAICYVCGFKRKRTEMKLRWDGVWTCKEDWEIRHPQDFVRGIPEETAPEWTQPEPPDQFLPFTNLYILDTSGNVILDTNGNPIQGTH
jgi:hypothetical protein